MTSAESVERSPWSIPPAALAEWLALAGVLATITAPCTTSDPEAWFPADNEVEEPPARMAIAACEFCPARGECRDYAIAADERFGIWAGTLPRERRALRQQAA